MATIEIRHPHKTTLDDAKMRTRRMVAAFAEEKRELIRSVEWQSDVSATAIGRGFVGHFNVNDTHVNVAIDLSFLVRPLKGKVETRLMQRLVAEFGEASA